VIGLVLMALNLTNVELAVGEKPVLNSIEFSLAAGELLAVIGPNGAGKTSLLRAIAGELVPVAGSIMLGGKNIHELSLRVRSRQVAVLPQLSSLTFPFTVEEVILLGRSPHGTGMQRDKAIGAQVMACLDILSLRERLYTQLSGGEKQRVQLARVLAQVWNGEGQHSRLLLLDEPTSALDLGHQQMLMRTLKILAAQGVAIVMAVHDVNIASAYADRILALKDGHCVALGNPQEVLNAAVMHALFDVRVQVLPHPESGKPVALGLS
jgi:iron complex transport system ATP-binding protein